MEIRLQTAAIQASKRSRNPKPLLRDCGLGEGVLQLLYPALSIHLYFLEFCRTLIQQGAGIHPFLELKSLVWGWNNARMLGSLNF
jgi:hypothetical protein